MGGVGGLYVRGMLVAGYGRYMTGLVGGREMSRTLHVVHLLWRGHRFGY